MLAKPTVIFSSLFILVLLNGNLVAEPIGSLKSIKKFEDITIKEAPNPDVNNNSNSNPIKVSRSQFTTAVVNREPTDNVIMLTNNSSKIYYFTELENLKGHNVTHRWQYQGKLMAEIKFDIKSDRWRVFSSKKIRPDWTGEWSVELVDEHGKSLKVNKLEIVTAHAN